MESLRERESLRSTRPAHLPPVGNCRYDKIAIAGLQPAGLNLVDRIESSAEGRSPVCRSFSRIVCLSLTVKAEVPGPEGRALRFHLTAMLSRAGSADCAATSRAGFGVVVDC